MHASCKIIISNNPVINIKENENNTSRCLTDNRSEIIGVGNENLLSNRKAEFRKPSTKSLFEAIESMVKASNLIGRKSVYI